MKRASDDLLIRGLPGDLIDQLVALSSQIEQRRSEIVQAAMAGFTQWVEGHGVSHVPLSHTQATQAMEAYFEGSPPLRAAKDRKDIPDAMIYQSVRELATNGALTFVCQDGNLSAACKQLPGVSVHTTLAEFIADEDIQRMILEQDAAAEDMIEVGELAQAELSLPASPDVKLILGAMEKLASTGDNPLERFVAQHAGERAVHQWFTSSSIPADDRRAFVYMFGELDYVEFHWEQAAYYGEATYMVPFRGEGSDFYLNYYVSKWDTERLAQRGASWHEHNQYVVEADEMAQLTLGGMLRIVLDQDYKVGDELKDAIVEMSIEGIDEIALSEDADW